MFVGEDYLLGPQAADEYTVTLEYELQREKEKNKVLEERIRNKQVFIAQMKDMQIELDELTQRCRLELQEERKARERLEKVQVRGYLEKIAQLEHQINQQRMRAANQAEPYQSYFTNEKINPKIKENRRSQKNLKKFESIAGGEVEDEKQARRGRFITHFLQMVQMYAPEIRNQSEKKQLKTAWRWIKDVVKQWDDQQAEIEDLRQSFQQIKEILGIDSSATNEEVLEGLAQLTDNQDKQKRAEEASGSFDEKYGSSDQQSGEAHE